MGFLANMMTLEHCEVGYYIRLLIAQYNNISL